jgi:hypothetical protein
MTSTDVRPRGRPRPTVQPEETRRIDRATPHLTIFVCCRRRTLGSFKPQFLCSIRS